MRAKLAAAEDAGPEYARNAEALRTVQPEDVLPGDIDANLGAPWIPESDIQAFAADLFGVEPDAIQVAHLKKDAVWSVEAGYAAEQSVAAKSDYGTARANGTWLLELALNMKTPVIYDPDPADPDKRVVNQEETLAAKEKQKADQGEVQAVGVLRPRPHRAAGAALQRQLQQPAAPAVRRLAPRLPRHEPGDHAAPAPEGRGLADA